jgi:hypothetical protein
MIKYRVYYSKYGGRTDYALVEADQVHVEGGFILFYQRTALEASFSAEFFIRMERVD